MGRDTHLALRDCHVGLSCTRIGLLSEVGQSASSSPGSSRASDDDARTACTSEHDAISRDLPLEGARDVGDPLIHPILVQYVHAFIHLPDDLRQVGEGPRSIVPKVRPKEASYLRGAHNGELELA
jgi:hypothetical protein